jgi:multimeric flavodoxin WrbA
MMRHGSTAIVLNAFISGLRENRGEIEIVNLKKLTINPCMGDLSCWFHGKNKCIQNDDMAGLIEKFKAADLIVFSTPVYCDGVPGQLKVMMDRLVVLGNPLLELRENHTRHPHPVDYIPKKFVLITSCGLWEKDNFVPMVAHLKAFCKNLGFCFCGALLRPHSFAMKGNDINDILHAAKKAGSEIIEKGTIDLTTEDVVAREIVSRETYLEILNRKANGLLKG